jgi:hypothetical protein
MSECHEELWKFNNPFVYCFLFQTCWSLLDVTLVSGYFFPFNFMCRSFGIVSSFSHISILYYCYKTLNSTQWPESASELYQPIDHRFSAKLVPTSANRGCHVVRVTVPYGRILAWFLFYSGYYGLFLHLVRSLRMHGALSPFPHVPSSSFTRFRDNITLIYLVIYIWNLYHLGV